MESDAIVRKIAWTSPHRVEAEMATIAVPVASLRDLPNGASYTSRQGRATATAHITGDTIYLRADCDSLEIQLKYYYEAYQTASKQAAMYKQVTEERKTRRASTSNYILICLFGAGAIGALIIAKKISTLWPK